MRMRVRATREGPDHYQVLGVSPAATDAELRDAYRALVRQLHPDNFQPEQRPQMAEKMSAVNASYQILRNPDDRMRYDRAMLDPIKKDDPRYAGAHQSGQKVYQEARQRGAHEAIARQSAREAAEAHYYGHGSAPPAFYTQARRAAQAALARMQAMQQSLQGVDPVYARDIAHRVQQAIAQLQTALGHAAPSSEREWQQAGKALEYATDYESHYARSFPDLQSAINGAYRGRPDVAAGAPGGDPEWQQRAQSAYEQFGGVAQSVGLRIHEPTVGQPHDDATAKVFDATGEGPEATVTAVHGVGLQPSGPEPYPYAAQKSSVSVRMHEATPPAPPTVIPVVKGNEDEPILVHKNPETGGWTAASAGRAAMPVPMPPPAPPSAPSSAGDTAESQTRADLERLGSLPTRKDDASPVPQRPAPKSPGAAFGSPPPVTASSAPPAPVAPDVAVPPPPPDVSHETPGAGTPPPQIAAQAAAPPEAPASLAAAPPPEPPPDYETQWRAQKARDLHYIHERSRPQHVERDWYEHQHEMKQRVLEGADAGYIEETDPARQGYFQQRSGKGFQVGEFQDGRAPVSIVPGVVRNATPKEVAAGQQRQAETEAQMAEVHASIQAQREEERTATEIPVTPGSTRYDERLHDNNGSYIQPTADKAQDGIIFKVLKTGLENDGKVVRKAWVRVYRYSADFARKQRNKAEAQQAAAQSAAPPQAAPSPQPEVQPDPETPPAAPPPQVSHPAQQIGPSTRTAAESEAQHQAGAQQFEQQLAHDAATAPPVMPSAHPAVVIPQPPVPPPDSTAGATGRGAAASSGGSDEGREVYRRMRVVAERTLDQLNRVEQILVQRLGSQGGGA